MSKETNTKQEDWQVRYKDITKKALKMSFYENLEYDLSKDEYSRTMNDNFWATAISIRDRVVERWIQTQQMYHKENKKRVYYLSMEFLIGRLLGNYAYNLGAEGALTECMQELGLNLEEIRDQEEDAGLGNGGLGRLAACFLDSMATLGIPAHGYGIRFDYGIFHQAIKNGYQIEQPDEWSRWGSPWEFARPEYAVKVKFYGKSKCFTDDQGRLRFRWYSTDDVLAVPYDIPIPGYKNDTVNTLRLWSARSTEDFDFDYFKHGDYEQAVFQKVQSEVISKVLYPNDDISRGRELRLKQEYFLTAATITDIIRRFRSENDDLRKLPEQVVIQLNDTHPSLAVVELMRVLLDEHFFSWDDAWNIIVRTFAYTNHTLMPEALECWSVELLGHLLPRHLQIIYEINARFLDEVSSRYPGDSERLKRMSIIQEGSVKKVRMAYLSIVASFSVNGVSQLHTDLLKNKMLKDFHEFYPGKFNNKTNGITQRRWLLKANPELAGLINEYIGDAWVADLEKLRDLIPLAENPDFRKRWADIKRKNKTVLANFIEKTMRITIDDNSMFDVQVKRIHEYKRQLLFALYMIATYLKLKKSRDENFQPRTFIVGGKAAPSYYMAKLTIKLVNSIAEVVNRDKDVNDKMKVVFLANYRVSLAEKIFPASDLSEQISTAGMEASGTGNMKFMLNGALTMGTLDGANIEIAELVGRDNCFIFGNKEDEINALAESSYNPQDYIEDSPILKDAIDLIAKNYFCAYNPGLFQPIVDLLYTKDPFFVCADFESYYDAQNKASELYQNQEEWVKKSILNVANAGKFSSDRTIKQYADEIWHV